MTTTIRHQRRVGVWIRKRPIPYGVVAGAGRIAAGSSQPCQPQAPGFGQGTLRRCGRPPRVLTTAGITPRSMGARVGRPRASADATGATLAIGLAGGGPGSGGTVKRVIHHPPATPSRRAAKGSSVFRMTEAPLENGRVNNNGIAISTATAVDSHRLISINGTLPEVVQAG